MHTPKHKLDLSERPWRGSFSLDYTRSNSMKLGLQKIPMTSLINRNWMATEMRVSVNRVKAQQYASEMKHGDKFPPPVVFIDKQEITRVGDGFHRIIAHQINGCKEMEIDLRLGEYLDAVVWNIECNQRQKGMPFSTGDKRKCISTLLLNPVASNWTQTKIAKTVGCARAYVSQVALLTKAPRPEIIVDKNGVLRKKPAVKSKKEVDERRRKIRELLGNGKMQTEIGAKLGISRTTVQRCIEADKVANVLVPCPHCNGSGVIEA